METKRILFLGTHGQYNIGDELLLETFLSQLGGQHHYLVNSYDPEFTRSQLETDYTVDVFHTTREPFRFLRYLLTADLVFFGGGSIIKELYSSVGRGRYSTLLMVLLTVTFARQIARKPVIMSNIGVGPIKTPRGKRLANWILRQVGLISVRDTASYDTCLTLGIEPDRVRLVPDTVFVNPANFLIGKQTGTPAHEDPPVRKDQDTVHIALNLNYDIENPSNWPTFQQNLADGLRALNQIQPIVIHALPMQSAFKEADDWTVLSAFRKQIPEIEMFLYRPEQVQEIAGLIAASDLLISERLHAIVIAAILGKPCIALMYDIKVRELVTVLELESEAIEINEPFEPGLLADIADRLLQAPEAASDHLLARSATLKGEMDAYMELLSDHMSKVT